MPLVEAEFSWRTIDCARNEPHANRGTTDDDWWLNLNVMFSMVTRMEDMLLLRPPSRELLDDFWPLSSGVVRIPVR